MGRKKKDGPKKKQSNSNVTAMRLPNELTLLMKLHCIKVKTRPSWLMRTLLSQHLNWSGNENSKNRA